MKAMQSLKSRGYVKEQFAWRHFYWYLTNEGIQYLRDYLHLPLEIVSATLHRSRPETGRPRPEGLEGERPARLTRGEADRDTYGRSAVPPGANKKAEAGAGSATEFQFKGRFGRGRGQPPQKIDHEHLLFQGASLSDSSTCHPSGFITTSESKACFPQTPPNNDCMWLIDCELSKGGHFIIVQPAPSTVPDTYKKLKLPKKSAFWYCGIRKMVIGGYPTC
ncbi:hypothetical protein H8959_010961 [Pygathrix nigripes]